MNIREAAAEDVPWICRLIHALADALGEQSLVSEDRVAEFLRFPGSGALVVEDNGPLVGLLSYSVRPNLYHGGPTALIEELIVDESHRGRGIGGILLGEFLRRMEESGCAEVSVTVMPENEAAQKFYRSHGLLDEALYLERHF
jgi:ribosomal protein S18 acetylase RimI-like enzyme